jgi:two-component system sensor histidine kinase MprB
LTAATEAIAESGRLDVDVPSGGSDETGRLAHSFAMMLDALRRSREQQQRLVQDAGHELRTPLTSLRTNVEVLRRHPELEQATRDRVLADVHSELRELTAVTNELVALATEEADDEPTAVVDVSALARRAAARTERRRRRTVLVDAEPWSVRGQQRQLLRVLDNVLDNAAKFDASGAPIEVVVRPGTITVRDHGAGIEPTDLRRIFDRFYRAAAARSRPGSGLGLAIASDVVRRHGGAISAANHPEDGALVTISLPVADLEAAGPGASAAPEGSEATPPMSHQTLT